MGLTYMYAYADCTRLQYQIKGRWFLYLFTLFISTAIIHIIYIYIYWKTVNFIVITNVSSPGTYRNQY